MPENLNDNDADAPARWRIVVLCMLFNVIDGLDAMAMAFTGSRVSSEWGLSASQLGVLLSASLAGMAVGSLIGSQADRYGRRPLLLAGLTLGGISMLLSFCSQSNDQLVALRILTGVGVGAVLVGANVLAYESSMPSRRNLSVALQSFAFALGASLGGLLAHQFNDGIGWRYVFLAGGAITLMGALAGTAWLRESTQFNAAEQQFRHVEYMSTTPSCAALAQVFASGQGRLTVSLGVALFLLMAGFYFVMSWTPTLMAQHGFSEKQGVIGGLWLHAGGMLGALLVGLLAGRTKSRSLLLALLLLDALVIALMSSTATESALALPIGVAAGLSLNSAIAALLVLAPQTFPTAIRASGIGLVLATGRLGAIISPALAGNLLMAQWSSQEVFLLFACSQGLAALIIWLGYRRSVRSP